MGELCQLVFPFYQDFFPTAIDKSQIEIESYFPSCVDMAKRVLGERLKIRSTGVGYALCLVHAEKSPSMRIKSDYVNCYGCGASWTQSQFYSHFSEEIGLVPALFRLNDLEFKDRLVGEGTYDALEQIAKDRGINGFTNPSP